MRTEAERLLITQFAMNMAQAVQLNSRQCPENTEDSCL